MKTRILTHLPVLICLLGFLVSIPARAQLTGTITVPNATYPTLASAITALNAQGVGAGGVTINVTAAQTAPAGGYLITASGTVANPVTITSTGNPTITAGIQTAGSTSDAIFKISGGDYITLSNLTLSENVANVAAATSATQTMTEVGIAIGRANTTDGASNNTVSGCSITMRGTTTYTSAYGIYLTGRHDIGATSWTAAGTATAAGGENNNNTFISNTIANVTGGFLLLGNNTLNDAGNRVGFAAGNGNTISMGVNGFGTALVVTLSGAGTSADGVQAAGNSNFTASYNTITYPSGTVTGTLAGQNGVFVTSSVTLAGSITNVTNNNITFNTQTPTGAGTNAQRGIYILGGISSGTANLNNNTITLNSGVGVNGPCNGILNSVVNNVLNMNSNMVMAGTFNGTGAVTFLGNTSAQITSANFQFNTFAGSTFASTATGNLILISNSAATPTINVLGNATTGTITRSSTTGACTLYYNFSSPGTGVETISNNNFSNFTFTAANSSAFYGIYSRTGTGQVKVISGDTVSNISHGTSTGAIAAFYIDFLSASGSMVSNNVASNVTTASASLSGFLMNGSNSLGGVFQNNTVSALTSTGASAVVTGMVMSNASNAGNSLTLSGNTITGLMASGASAPAVYGISVAAGVNDTLQGNNINTLSVTATTGTGSVNGIRVAGGTTPVILRNRIFGLSTTASGTTAEAVGINFPSGTYSPAIVANNFISGLQASAAPNSQAVIGINAVTFGTFRLFYNTVYLTPGASTATVFGATGVQYASGTTSLDLRNNIINVTATPVGTGTISALRRNTGTTGTPPGNYALTSNNNIFYTPNATNSFLYAEGTGSTSVVNTYNLTNDPTFNTPCGLYKTFMQGRDLATFTENNLSPAALAGTFTPTGSSYAQSNGQPIAGYSTDFSGALRGTPPDAGALEFTATALDAAGPLISYSNIPSPTLCIAPPVLTATITDASGVNTAAGTAPRLYYKKNTEANAFGGANNSTFNGWKWVEGTGTAPTFNFSPDYALLTTPIAAGDVIQYFVVAQDIVSTPNVGTNTAGYPSGYCPSSVSLPAAAGPLVPNPGPASYTIGATPTSLTASASPSQLCGAGPVTLSLSSASTGLTVQWQSATLTGPFSNIAGATTSPYTIPSLPTTTRFRANVFCGTTQLFITNEDTVTVSDPQILSTTPPAASQCGGGTFTVSATASPGTTVNWYSAPTGGALLGSGSPFTTPFISTTTTFYAAAFSGTGTGGSGGSISTGFTPNNCCLASAGVMFDVTPNTSITIDSLILAFNAIGSQNVAVYTRTGTHCGFQTSAVGWTLVSTQTVAAPGATQTFASYGLATPVTLPANQVTGFYINYNAAYAITPTPASCTAVVVSNPDMTINLGTATNALFGSPLSRAFAGTLIYKKGCESARTGVTAVVTPPATATATASGPTTICQGTSVMLSASPTGAGFNYQWFQNGAIIPGATSSTYAATQPGNYTVSVYTTLVCNDTSNTPITVTVQPVPIGISPTGPVNACTGSTVTLTGPTGTGLIYQWLLNNNPIPGATTLTYAAGSTGLYRVRVTTGNGCSDTSVAVQVTVGNPPANITTSGSPSICANGSIVLTGPAGQSLSYQWLLNGNNIAGATAQNYTATAAGQYTLRVSIGTTCSTFSSPIIVTTTALPPTAFTTSNNGNICAGSTVTLTGPVDLGYSYQWLLNNAPIAGANAQTYTASTAGSYRLRVTALATGCTDTSAATLLTARPLPPASTAPTGSTAVCYNATQTLLANSGSGLTYQWLLNTLPIAGATAQSYVANASGQYAVRVTSNFGCVNTSAPFTLTVRPKPPGQISFSDPLIFCAGGAVVLTAAGGVPNYVYSYQWFRNGVIIPGATASFYPATLAGAYTLRAQDSAGCLALSPAVTVTVNPTPVLTVTVSGATLTATPGFYPQYQWYRNNVAITGASGSTHTATQPGAYRVEAVDNNGCLGQSQSFYVSTTGISGAPISGTPILVYPNPASGILRIDAPITVKATLRNGLGQTVMVERAATQLDISRFPDGFYTLTLTDGEGEVVLQEKISKVNR